MQFTVKKKSPVNACEIPSFLLFLSVIKKRNKKHSRDRTGRKAKAVGKAVFLLLSMKRHSYRKMPIKKQIYPEEPAIRRAVENNR